MIDPGGIKTLSGIVELKHKDYRFKTAAEALQHLEQQAQPPISQAEASAIL